MEKPRPALFRGRHFEDRIIILCVRWYLRYCLTYRDLEELMAERGLRVDHSTIARWVLRYAPDLNKRIRRDTRLPNRSWRVDETYVRVAGKWTYLYRAVDSSGDTIDFMLSPKRDAVAAKQFLHLALWHSRPVRPRVINVDGHPAYPQVAGLITAIHALRLFEWPERPAKLKGVHASFPVFVRLAYIWATIAAGLGIWAAAVANSHGIWGASRHALTVGFLATMVFAVGQRVLPAFAGMRLLFSTRLMFLALSLLSVGCLLRVSSEMLAYQEFLRAAWSWLPVSAVIELTAVTVFAVNLLVTFARRRPVEPG